MSLLKVFRVGVAVAVSFTKHWSEEIAAVSEGKEFQNCVIQILDPNEVWYAGPTYPQDPNEPQPGEDLNDITQDKKVAYDWVTDTYADPVLTGVVYNGPARFIPIRAGVYHGGEAQMNATTVRSMRFQIPHGSEPLYIRKGLSVKFVSAPRNPSLVGRWASVADDFQGSSSASRTFNAFMDIDSGGPVDG